MEHAEPVLSRIWPGTAASSTLRWTQSAEYVVRPHTLSSTSYKNAPKQYDIQGVLEGTLVSWFGVLLVTVTRMDVLMCFRADILLEIPRVHVSK